MTDATRAAVLRRLRRADGQLTAICRMVEEDQPCVDVLLQISAVRGALSRVGQLLLGAHLETCVADAIRSGSPEEQKRQIEDLIEVFGRFGGLAGR